MIELIAFLIVLIVMESILFTEFLAVAFVNEAVLILFYRFEKQFFLTRCSEFLFLNQLRLELQSASILSNVPLAQHF